MLPLFLSLPPPFAFAPPFVDEKAAPLCGHYLAGLVMGLLCSHFPEWSRRTAALPKITVASRPPSIHRPFRAVQISDILRENLGPFLGKRREGLTVKG